MDGFPSSSISSLLLLLLSLIAISSSVARASSSSFNLSTVAFDEAYSPLFGHSNLLRSPDGRSVRLLLDRSTGSGFISSKMYNYGFFSANIKLPAEYTAGVCVAFYTSNGDVFEKNHDELDFEFLGNVKGKPWRFQTNLYGNGSTHRGREERYSLWFDPSKEFHRYSILWTPRHIIFYIDDVPIREVVRNSEMGGEYPSKPMSLYATIWDASSWATSGGRFRANYDYAPFVAEFKDLALDGCPMNAAVEQLPTTTTEDCSESHDRLATADYSTITARQRHAMRRFRQRYIYYSYCYDSLRYPVPPPECVIDAQEKLRFKDTGRLKFGGSHRSPKRRSGKRRNRVRVPVETADDPDM
ncbi:Probable xyloglucan endotransglucosylase/hydrolase protein 30 [Linum grandiflorum]